jgi:hypothetical protein
MLSAFSSYKRPSIEPSSLHRRRSEAIWLRLDHEILGSPSSARWPCSPGELGQNPTSRALRITSACQSRGSNRNFLQANFAAIRQILEARKSPACTGRNSQSFYRISATSASRVTAEVVVECRLDNKKRQSAHDAGWRGVHRHSTGEHSCDRD